MKIKVCGLTSVEQLLDVQKAGVDYAGMIFYEPSKRYAGEKLKGQEAVIKSLSIKKVGVFVNAEIEMVEQAIQDYGLSAVQLHGDETDEYCMDLMDKAEVIKVFRIAAQLSIDDLVTPFQEVCHYYLFDTDTAAYGGSGQKFNWALLEQASINKPFFLSGGISLEDVERIKALHHPYLFGVDVNSRFETRPGIKNMQLVNELVYQLKNHL